MILASLLHLGVPAGFTLLVIVGILVVLALDCAPTDLTMLSAALLLTFCGIISPQVAVAGFANQATLSVGALLVVAAAIRQTGALSHIYELMTPRDHSVVRAILRVMLPSTALSSIMNNTPIVAILAPMAQERGRSAGIAPSKLLIPLAYGVTLGGLITLIGTSTNLVVSGLLVQQGYGPLHMFDLTWIGIPAALAGIAYFCLLGHRLLPERTEDVGIDRNALRAYHFELRVAANSDLDGKTIEEAGLRALKGAFLAHLHRGGELIGLIGPDQVLRSGDVLAFVGDPRHVDALLEPKRLARVVEHADPAEAYPLQLFEAVVANDSSLAGKSLSEVDFRERFQAVVLGIHRRGERVTGLLGRIPIRPGDLLLIEAKASFEARAAESGDFYLVSPIERPRPRLSRKAPAVLAVLVVMVAVIASGAVSITAATFGAAVLMIAVGGISTNDARRSVDLSVLITIASGLAIAHATESTGLARHIAEWMVHAVHSGGPVAVLIAVYIATNVLAETLSHNAAAALVFPIAIAAAHAVGADVHPFAIAVAVAASAGFALPTGYQTYLMVMGPGSYRFRDFVKVGLPLNFIVMAVAIPIITVVFMR